MDPQPHTFSPLFDEENDHDMTDLERAGRNHGSASISSGRHGRQLAARANRDAATRAATKQRRASRACLSCNMRKVRCDFDGTPCSHCVRDGVQCVVPRTRRSRKIIFSPRQSQSGDDELNAGTTFVEAAQAQTPKAGNSTISELQSHGGSDGPGGRRTSHAEPDHVRDRGHRRRHHHQQLHDQPGEQHHSDAPPSFNLPNVTQTFKPADQLHTHTQGPSERPSPSFPTERVPPFPQLPPFIKPLNMSGDPARIAFLQSQRAFDLPPISVQCAAIQAYIDFAHPRMPILSLTDLCEILGRPDGAAGQVSLLLYQAILFTGCIDMDPAVAHHAGLPNKKALRAEWYRRTELLFEFDIETDHVVLIQTALLLTAHGISQFQRKDAWYWMNVAASQAYSMDLHRDPATKGVSFEKQRFLRRLWWCCYIRDKVIALGARKPSRLKDEDCQVPPLEMEDLERDLFEGRRSLLGHTTLEPCDKAAQLDAADLCLEKAKLSILISRVLQFQTKASQASHLAQPSSAAAAAAADTTSSGASYAYTQGAEFNTISAGLDTWYANLPRSCRYEPLQDSVCLSQAGASLLVRRQLVHMVYHTAVYVLHKSCVPTSPPNTASATQAPRTHESSREIMTKCVQVITRLAAELHDKGQDGNLPITASIVLYPAIQVNLVEMRSPSQEVRSLAFSSFRVCMRVMEKLQRNYSSSEMTNAYINDLLENIFTRGTHLPPVKEILEMNKHDNSDLAEVLRRTTPSIARDGLSQPLTFTYHHPAPHQTVMPQQPASGEGLPMVMEDIFASLGVGLPSNQMLDQFELAANTNNPYQSGSWSTDNHSEVPREALTPVRQMIIDSLYEWTA